MYELGHMLASRRRFLAGGVAVAATTVLAACGKAGDSGPAAASGAAVPKKKITEIAFDYPYTSLPVYTTVANFAKERAGQVGVKLSLTNDNAQLDTQLSNVSTLISRSVPAIVCFPVETSALEKSAASARRAGITWVTYAGNMNNGDASITFSFLKSGHLLAQSAADWAKTTLGGKGKIAFLTSNQSEAGRLRSQGMMEQFKQSAPGVQVVATQDAHSTADALTATNAVLSANPDLNIVLGLGDDVALGAYKALLGRGRAKDDARTFVGGQDGTAQALQLIKQGTFYRATSALDLKSIGYAVIDTPIAVAGGKPNASIDTAVVLINKNSPQLDQFLKQAG